MSLSLFQSALNSSQLSTVSAFPPPTGPDIFECKPFYSIPVAPNAADCRVAFNKIPRGTTPITIATRPGQGTDYLFPLKVQYGKYLIIEVTYSWRG